MPPWKSLCFIFLSCFSQILLAFAQIEDGGSRSDWVATNPVIECPTNEAQRTILCPSIFQPVCAYRNSSPIGTPGVTIPTFCIACFQAGYDFYSPGACEVINNGEGPPIIIPSTSEAGEGEGEGEGEFGSEEEMNLTENEEEVFWCKTSVVYFGYLACDSIYDPVCAYRAGRDKGTTVANSCEACGNGRGFDYYTEGPCASGDEEQDIQIDIEAIPASGEL